MFEEIILESEPGAEGIGFEAVANSIREEALGLLNQQLGMELVKEFTFNTDFR